MKRPSRYVPGAGVQSNVEVETAVRSGHFEASTQTELASVRIKVAYDGSLEDGQAARVVPGVAKLFAHSQSLALVEEILIGSADVTHEIVNVSLAGSRGALQRLHSAERRFDLLLQTTTVLLEPRTVLEARLCTRCAVVEEGTVLQLGRLSPDGGKRTAHEIGKNRQQQGRSFDGDAGSHLRCRLIRILVLS